MINSNSYYQIGSSHKFCEDYALHGRYGGTYNVHYGIVCDGCSSSLIEKGMRMPINVDFGARLLAISTRQVLKEHPSTFFAKLDEKYTKEDFQSKFVGHLIDKIGYTMGALDLKTDVLDATLLVTAYDEKSSNGFVFCMGDGAVSIERNGFLEIYIIDYDSNAPFYFSYLIDEDRRKRYVEQYGKEKLRVKKVVVKAPEMCESCGYKIISSENDFIVQDATEPILFNLKEPCLTVTLFSDGVKTFGKKEKSGENISAENMVMGILDFRFNYFGEYLVKRFNLLNRNCKDAGYAYNMHSDDLACAGFNYVNDALVCTSER